MYKKNITDLLNMLSEGMSAEDMLFAHYASDIAVAITSKRISLGLNQTEFAEKIGKSQTLISKWENADCNFTLKTLIEIAQALDLTLNISFSDSKAATPQSDGRTHSHIIRFPGYTSASSAASSWEIQANNPDEPIEELKEN